LCWIWWEEKPTLPSSSHTSLGTEWATPTVGNAPDLSCATQAAPQLGPRQVRRCVVILLGSHGNIVGNAHDAQRPATPALGPTQPYVLLFY
jgi:hypothetical protein